MKKWLAIVLPLSFFLLAVATGSVLLWRVFVFTAFVLPVSFAWSYLALRGIDVTMDGLPDGVTAGEPFNVTININRRSRLPGILLEIEDKTPCAGIERTRVFNIRAGSRYEWRRRLAFPKRGRCAVGEIEIRASDPLGIFPGRFKPVISRSLIVYPPTFDLPVRIAAAPVEKEYLSGWLVRNAAPEATRVREFMPGDSLNHIHWRSTAHTGRLMAKVFEKEQPGYIRSLSTRRENFRTEYEDFRPEKVWIVLDSATDGEDGSGEELRETGVTVAASLVKKYLVAGVPTGIITGREGDITVPPEAGAAQEKRLMELLACISVENPLPLSRWLRSRMKRFAAGEAVIIVSSDWKALSAPAAEMAATGVAPVLIIPVNSPGMVPMGAPACTAYAVFRDDTRVAGNLLSTGLVLRRLEKEIEGWQPH